MPEKTQTEWQEKNYAVVTGILESLKIQYSHYTGKNDDHHAFGEPIKVYIQLVSLNPKKYPAASLKVIVQENKKNDNKFESGNNWYGAPSRHIFISKGNEFSSYSNLIELLNSI